MPFRGELGVFGRVPSRLLLLLGVGGTELRPRAGFPRRVRDSVESAALYFFADPSTLGVVERGRRVESSERWVAEAGRFGVKGTGRTSLLVVADDDEDDMGGSCWGLRRAAGA